MRFLYLLMTALLISPAIAQQTYRVQRGERPVINLQSVPENAYYKGVLKIKLNESFTRLMDENPAAVGTDGIVRFGIEAVDQLNAQFGVHNFSKPFDSPAFSAQFTERHRAWGFHLWYKLEFNASLDIKELVQAYSALGEIMVAEPEYIKVLVTQEAPILYTPETTSVNAVNWTPNDPRYNEQWHYDNTGQQNGTPDADIDLPEAWEITKGNPEVIVAIVDGGINYTHNDLAPNMWPGIGYNFVTNSPNVSTHDHGTHVAGTVAGVTNNSIGVAGVAGGTGAGDGVRLMSCQVFTNGGSGGFENAPVWAADNGAAISQNSWGYTSAGYYDQNVLDAIDYFNINGGGDALVDGGITIFAAGNSDSPGQWYPGYYSGCFTVAGLTNQDKKAWYSNYDTWIDVAAPGGETDQVNQKGVLSTLPNNSYGFYQGTSMACPHVSGLAALIASLAYGQFTPQQVADIIKNTTDDIYAVNPGFTGQLGTGRINALAALTEALDQMILVNNPLAFSALASNHQQINLNWVKNNENNEVMVAWSTSSTFGDPVQTQVYEVGDTIEGGGLILFKGAESTFSHTGLNSNTSYYYKAWSLNEVPEYSPGLESAATTLKEPITRFPYHESFDSVTFPPSNWENKQQTGIGLWDRQTVGTNPACAPQSGDGMAHFNSYVYETGTSGLLVTPPIQFVSDEYETSLWVYRDGELASKTDRIEIYANIAPNAGFATLLGTINRSRELAPVEPSEGWYQYTFEIPATYQNKLTYLVFKGISDQGNNLFIDDVHVQLTINCFPPNDLAVDGITSGSSTVSWTGVAPATAWDVEYGPAGFVQGTGTMLPAIGDQTIALAGLESNTAYEVYVRGACATDETSTWTGPAEFTTLCSASTPWDETFEAMNDSFDCWQVMRNTAEDGGLNGNNLVPAEDNTWFVCTPESFDGNGAAYILNSERSAAILPDAAGFNWLISGDILIPETGKTDLSFWLNSRNDEAGTTLFHVAAFNGTQWATLLTYDNPAGFSDPFSPVHVNLDMFAGTSIRLALVFEESNGYALAVDDINFSTATNYWTGSENSTFTNPANWRLSVPQSNDPVHIFKTENTPLINEVYYLLNVFIHPGAQLILGPGAQAEIGGTLFNESDPGGFLLQANETSHAMLKYNGIGHATIERYLQAANGKQGWQLFSAAVSGQPVVPEFFTEQYTENNNLLKWDEPSGEWINAWLSDNSWNPLFETSFEAGIGYLTAFSTPGIREFAGFPNTDDLEIEIPNTGGAGNGWHLLANPYPANYQWPLSSQNIGKIAKIWDSESASYIDLYPGGIIPALTGFWIQTQPGESLTYDFDGALRTFEDSHIPLPGDDYIILKISETEFNTSQSCIIRKLDFAVEEYDANEDSRFMAGFAPQFYAMAGEEKLSTSSIPSVASGRLISLGFEKNEATSFSLDMVNTALYPGAVVFLTDLKTGMVRDLLANPVYNFTAEAGDDPARFELNFGTVGIDDKLLSSDFRCYAVASTIYLQSTQALTGEVVITDLSGKELMRVQANGRNLLTVEAGRLASGIYLVSMIGEKGIITRKVMLNK